MDPSRDAKTITIDREYFNTIVRRARFNSDYPDTTGLPILTTIPTTEYEELLTIARQYEALRQNLLAGGVSEETVAFLSRGHSAASIDPHPATAPATAQSAAPYNGVQTSENFHNEQSAQSYGQGRSSIPTLGRAGVQHQHSTLDGRGDDRREWADAAPCLDDDADSTDMPAGARLLQAGPGDFEVSPSRPQYERVADRTLTFANLADGVTHGDITAVVRGGLLLDIYMRSHDRSATVSFLEAADAKAFHEHVRRHDLYIKNKRVDVRWHDRQFVLPGHVANKIGNGATRNLVIRRCDPKHTEESIREDLEHIHNLVVIKIMIEDGDCHISTNSVHNAIFARTCMISRLKYKGSKVEWDLDECAQPLGKVPPRWAAAPREKAMPKKALNPMANRFQLLNLDGEDEDNESEMTRGLHTHNSVDIAA